MVGLPAVFGRYKPKIDGSRLAFYILRTVKGEKLDYYSLKKRIRSPKTFASKSARNVKRA